MPSSLLDNLLHPRDHELQIVRWSRLTGSILLIVELLFASAAAVALATEILDCRSWAACVALGAPTVVLTVLLGVPLLVCAVPAAWYLATARVRGDVRLSGAARTSIIALTVLYAAGYVLVWWLTRTFG